MPQCRKTEFLREILFTDGKNYVIISKQNLIFITQSGDYINMKRVLTLIMALTLLCCSGCCGGKKSQIMPTAAEVINQEPEKLNYSDVHGTTAGNIAHNINANATVENKKIAFSLNFKDIEWNGKVNIDPSVPRNYKRMSARDLFSMFSN